ncbi:MAG TPA: GGDEF domain-containing protein [Steroidobacteraceae bacterium]|nr:GGDEF domain-containing protein [Steroidobacteraceae bacterium]
MIQSERNSGRQLRMLTACHRIIIRSLSETALLDGICAALVQLGGYTLAWIGYPAGSLSRALTPIAHAGDGSGYLQAPEFEAALGSDDLPAIRAVCDRAAHGLCVAGTPAEDSGSWRGAAQRRGFEAVLAVPLLASGDCLGVLEICSRRADAFDGPEVALIQELADEVAYGIAALRTRAEHWHQQQAILNLTRLLRMQSSISAAVLRIRDRDELLSEVCRIAIDLGRYDQATLWIVAPDGRSAGYAFQSSAQRAPPHPLRLEISDGSEPDTSLTGRALRTGEVTVCRDVSLSEVPILNRAQLLAEGVRSLVALPLSIDGARAAAVTLSSRDPLPIREEELRLLEDIAATLTHALESLRREDAAAYLASYDSTTGLANRAIFCARVDELLSRVALGPQSPAIVALDVHHLHDINDMFGRHVGDALLRQVAERLRDFAGDEKRVGYVGAGTFLLAELDLESTEESVASLLEETVFSRPYEVPNQTVRVSCRSGVARYPADGVNAATLTQNAEAALKHAKEVGERYLHYKLSIRSEIVERLALEQKLREAIDREEFELHYQPVLAIASGRIESVEALLRWRDPEQGLVLPKRFLPILESSGLIVTVGAWALERAARDCERWRAMGFGPLRVAVNVSAVQIRRRSFIEELLELLSRELTSPLTNGIDLEITESMLMQDLSGAERRLETLRAAGVRIALDDFGTGYSSLGLLSRLPVDVLKIDRSFIHGLPHHAASLTLTRSIIGLAAAFGLRTVAEGVETPAQLDLLRRLACDCVQGFLHAPPLPAAELEAALRHRRAGESSAPHALLVAPPRRVPEPNDPLDFAADATAVGGDPA